ncbi:hypothetical protein BGZ92_011212 [Podila epicladia]|nr:hypothetical protein BGZ92_011212 [Podila epicladia]
MDKQILFSSKKIATTVTTATTATTTTAANIATPIAATTTTTTTTTAANIATTTAPTTTATTAAEWPRTCNSCFQSGGVVTVNLKHVYSNAKAQGNQIGILFAQRAAVAGPLMEMHHLFVVTVAIGTPPKEYDLVIDTSSVESWFTSPTCSSKACKNRKPYNSSESTSSENQFLDFRFHHGEGATGHSVLFTESLTIAEVTVENQIIGVVMSLSDPFTNLLGDGILALPPFDIKSPSFVDNAFDGGKLSGIIFAVYLPRSGEGEITIGGVNTARYTGNLTYISLSYSQAWQITIEDIKYQGRSLGIMLEATIDTTASSILLDKRAAYALYWKVPGAKRIVSIWDR